MPSTSRKSSDTSQTLSNRTKSRTPIVPSLVVIVGLLVGLSGLSMLYLGLGGTAPFQLQVPGLGAGVQTTSVGLAVMVIGFGLALAVVLTSIRLVAQRQDMRLGDVLRSAQPSTEPEDPTSDN